VREAKKAYVEIRNGCSFMVVRRRDMEGKGTGDKERNRCMEGNRYV